jgi:hypothetical protein
LRIRNIILKRQVKILIMKKRIFTIGIILFSFLCKSQTVNIIEKNVKLDKLKNGQFELIDSNFDFSKYQAVARLQGKAKKSESETINKLFYALRYNTNKIGANAYRIDSISDKKAIFTVYITVYHLTETDIKNNQNNFQQNEIIIFGEFDKFLGKNKVTVNSVKFSIEPLHFLSIPLEDKQVISINSGGMLGSNISLVGSENMDTKFYKVGKAEAYLDSLYPERTYISSGSISEIEKDLGQFLVKILYED